MIANLDAPEHLSDEIRFHVLRDVDLRNTVGLDLCPPVRSAQDVAEAFGEMAHLDEEFLIACAVDEQLRLVRWCVLAKGRRRFSELRPVDALIGAVRSGAKGVILVENRKSKQFRLDEKDIAEAVSEAGHLLGYPLLDHVVIGQDGEFWSRAAANRAECSVNRQGEMANGIVK